MNNLGAAWWWKVIPQESVEYSVDALNKGLFTTGPRVRELEKAFSQVVQSKDSTLTNSGTSALVIALLASNIGPGDEVIVPALTWVATAQAARILGCKVITVDVDYETLSMNPDAFSAAVTSATRAVIPVFFNGHSPRMSEILKIAQKSEIAVIEDRCKALGTTIQSGLLSQNFLHLAAFSLGMISPLSIGYGGVLISNNASDSNHHKQLRDHGMRRHPDHYDHLSLNFKISDVLASLGTPQIKYLARYINTAIHQEQQYAQDLAHSQLGKVIQHKGHEVGTYCMFLAHSPSICNEILAHAKKNGVAIARYHPTLDFVPYIETPSACNVAQDLSSRLLHLPCGPHMAQNHIARAVEILS